MSKIKVVSLDGYKGSTCEYELGGPTILCGLNGTGKSSCLEGVTYALTGRVPGGQKLDTVAAYFPARGGTVRVEDSDGRWIHRGVVRDGTKISEILQTSDEPLTNDAVNLSAWQVSEVVIDIQEFVGLSPEKRREFVLRLCGGGATPAALSDMLALEYARQIGGVAATANLLSDPPADMPDAVANLILAWSRRGGIRENLLSYLGAAGAGKSLSEIFLQLTSAAKEGMLGSRRAAQDAAAAIAELEVEAKGARASASDIDGLRQTVEVLREELSQRKAAAAQIREAHERVEAAEIEVAAAIKAKAQAADMLAAVKDPGPRPERPEPSNSESAIREQLKAIYEEIYTKETAIKGVDAVRVRADFARRQFESAQERHRQANETSKHGKLLLLMEAVPDEAHVDVPPLRAAVKDLCASWVIEVGRLEAAAEKADAERRKVERELSGLEPLVVIANEELAILRAKRMDLDTELLKATAGAKKAEQHYATIRTKWEADSLAFTTGRSRHEYTIIRETNARSALKVALYRHEHVQDPTATAEAIEAIAVGLAGAEREYEQANAAAGAVLAYSNAVTRAERGRVDERAWKAADAAIKVLRERVVAQSTGGLEASINDVLAAAGRSERVYLRLENERSKPIFELGWRLAGQETSLIALSTGESVIFLAALSIALTLRCQGRRLLLVEADPLDTANLSALLAALLPQKDKLEAIIVATAAVGWTAPAGWCVKYLGGAK